MQAASEIEVVQALQAGNVGRTVRWGFRELDIEGAEKPPTLPLIVLQRTGAFGGAYLDMCDPDDAALGDVTVQVRTWSEDYADARALNAVQRGIVRGLGWNLISETDLYDPVFRAWCITGEYTSPGTLLV